MGTTCFQAYITPRTNKMQDQTIPFKGLDSFNETDASFFFGREKDREMITTNLPVERLTVIYGPSGVGKSSLLRAGVVSQLHRLSEESKREQGKPLYATAGFNSWRGDPSFGLKQCILDCLVDSSDDKRYS